MLRKCFISLTLLLASGSVFAQDYWIDVRVPQQYKKKHLNDAVNIPLMDLRKRIDSVVKDKDATIHVYCNSGRQSEIAKNVLTGMGYTDVIDEGGIDDILAK